LSRWGKEELEYLSSLGEGHFLVQFSENFQVEGGRRVGSGNLHHLVYGFGRDEEQDLSDEEMTTLFREYSELDTSAQTWENGGSGEKVEG
jgi:hypothetical protein